MTPRRLLSLACLVALAIPSVGKSADSVEPFLRKLPPGLYLKSSLLLPAKQVAAIGKKFGGNITQISNSVVLVHGNALQVNVITTADDASAKSVHAAFLKIKSSIFCLRKGRVVVEYVIRNNNVALAMKASYEIGLLEKPKSVRYRVLAELATIERADYMSCNPLFLHFLTLRGGANQEASQQINTLAEKFTFGRSLELRNPQLGNASATYKFAPAAKIMEEAVATVSYSFDRLPTRQGVPFVTATLEITVDHSGLCKISDTPSETLTAPTPFWPVDDPQIKELALQITRGKISNGAKAMAILQWLAPGKHLQYSGQTGTRWGTLKALEQKFGHCWDFSDCFVTLARAAGVPSRQVAGWFYGVSGHVWAEFYREGRGWQQVDPTGAGKIPCGIYHIPYFTSEDGEMPIVYLSMPKIEVVHTEQ